MLNNKYNIDKTTPVPMFYQLKQILLRSIKSETYKVGDMIPTEADLSAQYDISRTTVRQAILELVQEGYLTRTKGKGTFVAKQKIAHTFIQKPHSFEDEMRQMDLLPSTEVLELVIIKASLDIAKALNIKENDKVIFLYRKRMADNEPIVTIKTYLPYDTCAFVLKHDLVNESLYNILSQNPQTKVCKVNRKIEASIADECDANLLEVKKGQPIHQFESSGMSHDGIVIEYSQARYRGDRSSFEVSIILE